VSPDSPGAVAVLATLVVLLVAGLVLALRWGTAGYRVWDRAPSAGTSAARYLRGLAIAVVAGFWAGALVTGPAIRLIMRLLAMTGGDTAQGRLTEANEVVGEVNVGGTIALVLFGGVLPGLLSGVIYVLGRRLLPGGRLGGVTFGLLHLVVLATRLDPLRPGNPDFDLVGPGWLSVAAFALAAVAHGMAVAAFADRYSASLPPAAPATRGAWAVAVAPLALPALLVLASVSGAVLAAAGLVVAVVAGRVPALVRAAGSPRLVMAGRVALAAVVVALLPWAVADMHDIVVRDEATVNPSSGDEGVG
jgi:hypothetical protein